VKFIAVCNVTKKVLGKTTCLYDSKEEAKIPCLQKHGRGNYILKPFNAAFKRSRAYKLHQLKMQTLANLQKYR